MLIVIHKLYFVIDVQAFDELGISLFSTFSTNI